MMKHPTDAESVYNTYQELTGEIVALSAYIKHGTFATLSPRDRSLLFKQLSLMAEYGDILQQRCAFFGLEVSQEGS
jgi:hypothetical protein